MKGTLTVGAPVVVAVAALAAVPSAAQQRMDFGQMEYESNCMVCHGERGKGDGPFTDFLKIKVPDLTTLSERNSGVFPAERLREIIDGRTALKGHGPRMMPVWGSHYDKKAAEYYKGFAYNPEQFVNVRIMSLIDYVYGLQTKR